MPSTMQRFGITRRSPCARGVRVGLVVVALGLCVTACGSSGQATTSTGSSAQTSNSGGSSAEVKLVSLDPSGGTWPLLVADAQGFFKREGVSVKTTYAAPTLATKTLESGAADIAFTDGSIVLANRADGLVAIGSGVESAPYFLVTKPSVKTFAQLKGQTLAVSTPTSAYTDVLNRILQRHGINPASDVKFIYGNESSVRRAQLASQHVAASILVPPEDSPLLAKGFHALYFFPDQPNNPQLSLLATRKQWAKEHPSVVRKFLAAYAMALKWLKNPANKQSAIDLLATKTQLPRTAAAHSYNVYLSRNSIFPGPCIDLKGMNSLVKTFQHNGALKDASVTGQDFMDTSYCPAGSTSQ